jgi:protoporphyrinogen oxidase
METGSVKKVVVIGASPAGLTAAYVLRKAGVGAVVLEKDTALGGLSRTVNHRGYRFDIGGHRFFTKVRAVDELWREVLGARDFLRRPRLSRIFYGGKFFQYPLRILPTLRGLGPVNALLILLSYVRARLSPSEQEETFEQWVTNRFGRRLYRLFFKTYTEKVWGIPCDEISAEWAAQRIKGLSLFAAVRHALGSRGTREGGGRVRTLTEEFDYPRLGPGMMWEAMAAAVIRKGGEIRTDAPVERILWEGGAVTGVEVVSGGRSEAVRGTHFVSSMPVRELVEKLSPAAPREVLEAAARLGYRDFITVALVVNRAELFPDNWIYIHEPGVKVGRIQNFKNWSPDMVPDEGKTCLGLEYFCFEGDGLWTMTDEELIELGKSELESIGLIKGAEVEDGSVVRTPEAYPVYDAGYAQALGVARDFLRTLKNLQPVGRNGMHRYNNQDHSMLTAMLAAENVLGAAHDLWQVNADPEYIEQESAAGGHARRDLALSSSTQPPVPERIGTRIAGGSRRP